jgi:hypothetical protein
MNRVCWRFMEFVSGLLDPDERDAVRGDLQESGETGRQALASVMGLVIRRQAALWMNWRTWIALATVVLPTGWLLGLISRHAADGGAIYIWLYAHNWDWSLLSNLGFQHYFPRIGGRMLLSCLALGGVSWIAGLFLAWLTRRMIPVTCALLVVTPIFAQCWQPSEVAAHYNPAVFALTTYRVVIPILLQAAFAMLPLLWSIHRGLRPRKVSLHP